MGSNPVHGPSVG
ncbi:hypothetical protein E2C01_094986 [Portunus trituberculatus]|nr:hypothetical protein [Portunus trituberculatus]